MTMLSLPVYRLVRGRVTLGRDIRGIRDTSIGTHKLDTRRRGFSVSAVHATRSALTTSQQEWLTLDGTD